jgi:hypothetical protein
VVPLAVSCFLFSLQMLIRYIGVPSMPPGHCQGQRKAKLPHGKLNNISCHSDNLVAHIPTAGLEGAAVALNPSLLELCVCIHTTVKVLKHESQWLLA